MFATRDFSTRLAPRAMPANIQSSQPGGGWVVRVRLLLGSEILGPEDLEDLTLALPVGDELLMQGHEA